MSRPPVAPRFQAAGPASPPRPEDALNIAYWVVLGALAAFFASRLRQPLGAFATCVAAPLVYGFLVRWLQRGALGVLGARVAAGAVNILVAFFTLPLFVPDLGLIPGDLFLGALDTRLLGAPAIAFVTPGHPVATEVLQLAYASFYALPFVLLAFPEIRDNPERVHLALLAISAGFFLTFAGYVLIPTAGPGRVLDAFTVDRQGFGLAGLIDRTILRLEPTPFDCFPSGHVAVTAIIARLAWTWSRRAAAVLVPVGLALTVATVYLRHHYVADVIAGVILAVFCLYAARRWQVAFHDPQRYAVVEADAIRDTRA